MGALEGRVAVVTGASRGIGEYVARRFASEGAAVAVVARTLEQTDERLPGTIHQTVATIRAAGGTAVAIQADLSKPADRPGSSTRPSASWDRWTSWSTTRR